MLVTPLAGEATHPDTVARCAGPASKLLHTLRYCAVPHGALLWSGLTGRGWGEGAKGGGLLQAIRDFWQVGVCEQHGKVEVPLQGPGSTAHAAQAR